MKIELIKSKSLGHNHHNSKTSDLGDIEIGDVIITKGRVTVAATIFFKGGRYDFECCGPCDVLDAIKEEVEKVEGDITSDCPLSIDDVMMKDFLKKRE